MKTTFIRAIAPTVAVLCLGAAGTALAAQRITVDKNHSTRISLPAPAGSVIVGNPAIADVTVVDSRTLYIVGRGYGRSSVTVTDAAGRTLYDGDVTVGTPVNGGITVHKGLKATTLVCAKTCVEQSDSVTTDAPPPPPSVTSGS